MNQQQGSDLAAPDSKPTQSELESAQATIEDKLNNIELHKILNRVFVPNPDWKKNKVALKRREFRMRQIKDLQAIITTETTKAYQDGLQTGHAAEEEWQTRENLPKLIAAARIEEIKWMQKQIPKKVKGVNYGTPENNPHGWAYETYIEAWKPVLKARLKSLQKEHHD